MEEGIKFFVGVDAHKESLSVAACEAGSREAGRFVGTVRDLRGLLKVLGKAGKASELHVVYEAGPTGYGLYRELKRRGYRCEVIAPSKIARRSGERIKNDRRDCVNLAEQSRAGQLTAIWVPDEAHESIRNLWRAREDAVRMRLQSRQQLKAFLLRQGRVYSGKTSWTVTHRRWIASQAFEQAADQMALAEYQLAVEAAEQRVERLTQALSGLVAGWRFEPVVAALRALRGIDTVSAVGLIAEIGDIGRFPTARHLMGYLGLVPSEHSSGSRLRHGSITKTGNAHARRLLTEAAWNYRFGARIGKALRDRSAALPQPIREHAWKAQQRLCGRFARLDGRGVQRNKVGVAVARELAGFIWAIARMAQSSSAAPAR